MLMIQSFLTELDDEAKTTRKMLSIIPNDKFNWQPHPKSMTIRQLATHIAELPSWIAMVLTTSELDFAKSPYQPIVLNSTKELLDHFEKNLVIGRTQLESANEKLLAEDWTLRNGEEIYDTSPKRKVLRMVFNQIVHHRAQLGVDLRLLDIPLPSSYGPTADVGFM